MLQVRKLVLAVAAATTMASGVAHALGLGEVSVKSALNEPLVAEIELLETRGVTAEEIRSQLASVEDFSRAGIDRQFFLNNLKFTPVIRPNGKSFVRITSSQAVREPFLNFLLEVYWPAGRVMKEYTLLLDPPMYTPQEVVYTQPAVAAPRASAGTPRPAPQARPVVRQPAAQRPAPTPMPALQGDQYRVQSNDTLWEIALRAGGSRAAVHQTMLAIQDLNPGAFIDGNINMLKNNQVLKLPTEEQIRRRSRNQALTEVQAQTDAWRAGSTTERQIDARRRETAEAAPAAVEKDDSLRLVAAETGKSETGSDGGADVSNMANALALTKERLDSVLSENADLSSRVEDLNSQVEKLQRLLELKNTQLANLQNMADEDVAEAAEEIAEEPVEAAVETTEETPVADPVAEEAADEAAETAAEEAVVAEETATEQEEEESEAAAEAAAGEAAEEADETAAEDGEEATAESQPEEAVAEQAEPEQEKAEEQAAAPAAERKPAPVIDPVPAPKSFVEELMENPMFLPGAGAGAALLVLLLLLSRRRAGQAADEGETLDMAADAEAEEGADELQESPEDLEGDLVETALQTEAEQMDAPGFVDGAALSDPVAEAENYIAFGRFNQAVDVLLGAIDQEPQRQDLRFKLLEVYADLEDLQSFEQQVEELVDMGVAQSELDALKQRYPHLMGDKGDELDLDRISLDLPGEEDDIDMLAGELGNLDELTAETDEAAAPADAEPETTVGEDDFASLLVSVAEESGEDEGIEFNLDGIDLDSLKPEAAAEVAEEEGEEMLDFELGDLDDLKLPGEEEAGLDLDVEAAVEETETIPLPDDNLELETGLETSLAEVDLKLDAEDGFDLDFDLSLADDQPAEELDTASLEAELEEIGADLEQALEDNAAEVEELAESADEEMDAFFANLDSELDLSTAELEAAMEPNLETEPEAQPEAGAESGPEFEPVAEAAPQAQPAEEGFAAFAELEQDIGEDFGFLDGHDEDNTKLDLARALIDMGDIEGAREILDEVASEGAEEHQASAREMLDELG